MEAPNMVARTCIDLLLRLVMKLGPETVSGALRRRRAAHVHSQDCATRVYLTGFWVACSMVFQILQAVNGISFGGKKLGSAY